MIGRPEVFFEGSWSQVCAARFGAADSNVACRQLGYGAGTVVPQFTSQSSFDAPPRLVPPVAFTLVGCTGSEERLIDCGPDESEDYEIRPKVGTGCLGTSFEDMGLFLGCVTTYTQEDGAIDFCTLRHVLALPKKRDALSLYIQAHFALSGRVYDQNCLASELRMLVQVQKMHSD